ncbi:hypothetical protein [Sutcliffiella rhizosphaerae]|uniref:hypothetical protein n=1 Tax=Sutcliffiella rhizosphaerae TaxID=2880967 RepID=UPI001E5994D7|nr:hypothetical protein [Sutcliffiella rhizosphaerae]
MITANRQLSSLRREDLLTIMMKLKEMGSNGNKISTEEFVKEIETHLTRAMSK